jgi:hypothetical protein
MIWRTYLQLHSTCLDFELFPTNRSAEIPAVALPRVLGETVGAARTLAGSAHQGLWQRSRGVLKRVYGLGDPKPFEIAPEQ